MSSAFRFLASLAAIVLLAGPATAANVVTIVFSGNNWGYIKPCPT